jgi:choline dehydrogenase-like flavoprotein
VRPLGDLIAESDIIVNGTFQETDNPIDFVNEAEMELKRMKFMADTCRRILAAAGVEERFGEYGSYDMFNTTHVFGTCRMGKDSNTSVVDEYCRSHRWRNLMVTDTSVFPSSGGGESPSLSIYANSLRAAHYIKRHGIEGA